MNILTFDIEDWYCHDMVTHNLAWENLECRIYEGVDRILDELAYRNLKGTFFCLGWLADHHPAIIRKIYDQGHQVGCHSYQHEIATRFDREGFRIDTLRAKCSIEDAIGAPVELFRAPAFSITKKNLYAFEVLADLGFTIDCSIFPMIRDYGGMSDYGCACPSIVSCNGALIKEFPMCVGRFMGRNLCYSGGGYFRLLPYWLIKKMTRANEYNISYFHPSDFDPDQPQMAYLPLRNRIKNAIGLKKAFYKFQKYLDDFEFVSVAEADRLTDWSKASVITL